MEIIALAELQYRICPGPPGLRGAPPGPLPYMGLCAGCWPPGPPWPRICCMGALPGILPYPPPGPSLLIGSPSRLISPADTGLIPGVEEMFFNKFGPLWIRLSSAFWTCGLSKLINEDIPGCPPPRGAPLPIPGEGLGAWEMPESPGPFRILRILAWSSCCCCWRLLSSFLKSPTPYPKNVV